MTTRLAHRAAVLHFNENPQTHGDAAFEFFPDGVLLTENGRVAACAPAQDLLPQLGETPVQTHANALITPGLVDTHIHFPQLDIIGSYGASLLDWLHQYAFPAELAFAEQARARAAAREFCDELLANGTTSALVFSSVHRDATETFFEEAERRRLRVAAGKVMMNRNAPAALLDTAASGYADSKALIEKWHKHGRLQYAVTPRFAVSCDDAQLAACGRLLNEHDDVLFQTHLSENHDELAQVAALFPQDANYTAVYARHGLARERSVFAHAIHLADEEWQTLARGKCAVAFCPTSNFFLGSGLFDARAARRHKVSVGLGSDVGGGTSFSLLRVMDEAYKCARLRGDRISPAQMWYWATLGGARALHMQAHVGSFAAGKEADFVVWNLAENARLAAKSRASQSAAELMFALAILGDARAAQFVFVLGEPAGGAGGDALPPAVAARAALAGGGNRH